MSLDNFAACLAVTLGYEGGFSVDRADPGNWTGGAVGRGTLAGTNFGISAAAHPTLDIRALTPTSVASIYRAEYWMPAGCDALAPGLDLQHFDAAVNSGAARAGRWLAKAQAASTPAAQIRAYADARLSALEALKTWRTFGRGWSARVAGVEAKALAMAARAGMAPPGTVPDAARRQARTATAAALATHASTATAGGIAAAAALGQHPAAAAATGVLAAAAGMVAAFTRWRAGARAAALHHAAA